MKFDDVAQMIGRTPHVRVRSPEARGAEIYIKLESYNPTGSIKDRAGIYLIRGMLEEGRLRPGMRLLEASSGNMACAIAFYGRLLGHPAELAVNSKLTADKRNFLLYYGARLHQVGDFTIDGNRFCRQMAEREPERYCFLDQLHNWQNPRAAYETLGPEILEAFPDVEMVVGSLGSGGSMLGTAQFLKERKGGVRAVTVQAAAGTKLPGTGGFDDGDYVTPFIAKGNSEGIFDHTVRITEADAVRRALQLRDQGVFCGLQAGGVLHAALEAVREFDVRGTVVIVAGDSGWKNMEKLLQVSHAAND
jgi:cysteine synthase